MSFRFDWLVSSFCAFACLSACAEGAPAAPPDQLPAQIPAPMSTCGDGIKDKNELCDCPPTATTMCEAPPDVTCASLMKGTGTVYCKPFECNFITDLCTAPMQGGGAGVSGSVAGVGG
jgi:hypothetical protein